MIAAMNRTAASTMLSSDRRSSLGDPGLCCGPAADGRSHRSPAWCQRSYGWGASSTCALLLPLIVYPSADRADHCAERARPSSRCCRSFVRTARAKGVPEMVVALRHILRPVLTPVVTQLEHHDHHRQRRDLRRARLRSAARPAVQAPTRFRLSRHFGDHAHRILPVDDVEPPGRCSLSATRSACQRCKKEPLTMSAIPLSPVAQRRKSARQSGGDA